MLFCCQVQNVLTNDEFVGNSSPQRVSGELLFEVLLITCKSMFDRIKCTVGRKKDN